ncbi:uncharacterized protein LOC141495590 isoform X2 [Macrotis lagotis]|uniref:uncharacterized protein LOC141495590 isoform X2 n=1 Tax=Macrotis lagotis TaxID=92651 RepID=UPI003D697918
MWEMKGSLLTLVSMAVWLLGGPPGAEALNSCPTLPISPTYCAPVNSANVSVPSDQTALCTAFTLAQFACAKSNNLTSNQLAAILSCHITGPALTLDQNVFLLLFHQVSVETLRLALNHISVQIDSAQIPTDTKQFILTAAWDVAKTDPQARNAGFLASWFGETLHAYLPTIDLGILECLSQLPIQCDGLAAIVQALDSVYSRMDSSRQWAVASWIKRFLTTFECPKSSSQEWIIVNWRSFRNQVSYAELVGTWRAFDGADALSALTGPQLAEFTTSQDVLANATLAPQLLQLLNHSDIRFTEAFLEALPRTPRNISESKALLETLLHKLANNLPDLCSPTLKRWFQELLIGLLPAFDMELLKLLPTQVGCTDFQAMYKGLDLVYAELSPPTQQAMFQARRNYLRQQTSKEGSACTFSAANSSIWLQDNFGLSSVFANYKDFLQLNPGFRGFEVTDLLTATQLGELLISSNILMDTTNSDAESNALKVIETFQQRNISELQIFLQTVTSLATQRNITSITNTLVSRVILTGTFQVLRAELPFMSPVNIEDWFGGNLSLYLTYITSRELTILSSVATCQQLQAIVKGMDLAFDQMGIDARSDVTRWVVGVISRLGCNISGDELDHIFWRFKTIVNITDLVAIDQNFDVIQRVEELMPFQLGQLWTIPGAISVASVQKVFDRLAAIPGAQTLTDFWDELSSPQAKPWNVSVEVRHTMLVRTLEQLGPQLPTLAESEANQWLVKRLASVLDTIDASVLRHIPVTLPCGPYRALITAVSSKYEDLVQSQKTDVFNFLTSFLTQKSPNTGPACDKQTNTRNWLNKYLGKFSQEATYLQLVNYHQRFDVGTVLDILTNSQVGDALVCSDLLTTKELDPRFTRFFQQSSTEAIHQILTTFTRTAHSGSSQCKIEVPLDAEPARWLLTSFLTLTLVERETFTTADWNTTFQEELIFFLPMFNESTLALVVPRDIHSLVTIVSNLDTAHSLMPAASQRAVALWILKHLRILNAIPVEPFNEWIKSTWGSFFSEVTLEEVKSLSGNFNPADVLSYLDVRQKVEFMVTPDVLSNVTAVEAVLESLVSNQGRIPLITMEQFLSEFNLALTKDKNPTLPAQVKQSILDILLPSLAFHFTVFSEKDYELWFQKNLRVLLPGISAQGLSLLPLDLSYSSYNAIVRAFDDVFSQCSPQTTQNIYGFIQNVLSYQLSISGSVFPGAYNNSQNYLQLFGQFLSFANYTELLTFYSAFNGYEVLDRLSAQQLGEMMLVVGAIRNERLAIRILSEMEQRPFKDMVEFLARFNVVAQLRGITILPDTRIRTLTLESIFQLLPFQTFTAQDYDFWFGHLMPLFLPGLNSRLLLSIPQDIDCQAQQNLVAALDGVFDHLTDEQRRLIHRWIQSYLEALLQTQGTTCSADATSNLWITHNYRRFRTFATMEEFSNLNPNFNGFSALTELSAGQLAQVMMQTGAFADESTILKVIGQINTTLDLAQFFNSLNTLAQAQLQGSVHKDLLLSLAFQHLSLHFPKFQSTDFAYWFQNGLQNVLQAVNETFVAQIPQTISCDAYQNILKGFNNIYQLIPAPNAPSVFGFCKAFLTAKAQSGTPCGHDIPNSKVWLDTYLGNFSVFADYQDLLLWNEKLQGLSLLDKMTPIQLASFAIQSGIISLEKDMDLVLARLQSMPTEAVDQFLSQLTMELQFSSGAIRNVVVRRKMLKQLVGQIQGEFLSWRPEDWTLFLSTKLLPLLPSLGAEDAQLLLSHVSGCDSFQAFVASLGAAYSSMAPENRQGVAQSLVAFLGMQANTTGSACDGSIEATMRSQDWLWKNFGPFVSDTEYRDFMKLKDDFNGFDIQENLTSTQLAHVFFGPGILEDIGFVGTLLSTLESRTMSSMIAFVTEFVSMAQQQGISALTNVPVRDAMFATIFHKVRSRLTRLSPQEYKDWFRYKLGLWLPSITAEALTGLPQNMPCGIFQIVMSGLEQSFPQMSLTTRQDVFNFAQGYLVSRPVQRGAPCSENTQGSLGWLQANLGSFSSLASYKDLVKLYQDFNAMDALSTLSPEQVAGFLVTSDILRDSVRAGKVMASLNTTDIGSFLDAFNIEAQEHHLTQLPNAEVGRTILGQILCHLSPSMLTFGPKDYTAWFGDRLALFLTGLDAQNFGSLPVDMSCDSLAALVQVLDTHKANGTYEHPTDIYAFVQRVLMTQQKNTGSACAQDAVSDQLWLHKYFGTFSSYASYKDLIMLKGDFQGLDSLDLVSDSVLAQMTIHSGIIYSPSRVGSVLEAIRTRKDPLSHLSSYLEDFNTFILKNPEVLANSKVQDVMMFKAADMIFPKVPTMSLEEANTWFARLKVLLPGVNITSLEMLPLSMTCSHYQAFIKVIGGVFQELSPHQKQAIYGFQKKYLAAQLADTGSACNRQGSDTRDWLQMNLGPFCSQALLGDLQALYPDFDGVQGLDIKTPKEMAHLIVTSNLNNLESSQDILEVLSKDLCLDVSTFMTQFNEYTQQAHLIALPNATVGAAILRAVLDRLSPSSHLFPASVWAEWFQHQLPLLLPFVTTSTLARLSTNVSCDSYQAVVKGFNAVYESLSAAARSDIYNDYMRKYLLQQTDLTGGSACPGNATKSADWLAKNLGKFSSDATLSDLDTFYPNITSEIEAFTDLVSEETFQTLGALAVGLTPSVILSKADGQMLNRTLPLLSTIRSWSPAQASIIIKKLLQNGLQLSQARDVLDLGTLVSGLPSSEVNRLSDDAILQLAADENFINILQRAPEFLQNAFVHRILQSNQAKGFPRVPAGLASQIPLSQLLSSQMDIDEINKMPWTPDQAQMLFQTVLKSPLKYSQLSSSLLQGFSCGAANFLKQSQFAELIRVLDNKHIRIDKSQINCTAKRLKGFITPSNFEEYPADILLYLGMEKDLGPDNCEKYFRKIGQVHFVILKKETSKWKTLVDQAEHCLGISSDSLSKENLQILGNLSCALNDSQIIKSDPYILQMMEHCSSFTVSQVAAIQNKLEDIFGSPSTWTARTLQGMGYLASILDNNILQRIPETSKTQFFPNFLSWLKIHHKEQFMENLKKLRGLQRNKRDTTCPGVPLTADRVRKERDMIAARYTSTSDLEACLPDSVLKNHLELFGIMEFEDPLLRVLKMKLDKILGVLSEDFLPLLGHIAKAYQPAEMAQWNITTSDTLVALLRGTSWLNHDEKVNAMINQYLKGNHTQLGGTILTALDPHICALEDHLLQHLSPEGIRELRTRLDISQCSQKQKNLIYHQVKATVQENQNTPNAYYQMLKSLLGGAPAEDLIQFASGFPVMDMDIFTALNPEEVKKLSPQNLKDLLDMNLSELNSIVDHPTVQAWVKVHTQAEVNDIGLKVMAGHPDPPPPDGFFVLTSAPPISRAEGALMKEHMLQISYTILSALCGVMISLGAS